MYSVAGSMLRDIIKQNGQDILNDVPKLEEEFRKRQCNEKVLYQILLMIKCSNLNRYIPQIATGISMIDINNIVSCAEKETGLSKKTIKTVLTCIFYGLSLPTELETVVFPTERGFESRDVVMAEFAGYDAQLKEIEKAIMERNNEQIVAYAQDLEKMAKSGHPEALYLKGYCYYCGVGTEENFSSALQCLEAAAVGGSIRANALLGDIYFMDYTRPDYNLAFKHYTVIGSVALSETRQQRVRVILEQKDTNKVDMFLIALLWIMTLVFNICLGKGSFSYDGASHWVSASFSIFFNTFFVGIGAYCIIKERYNSIKWVIPCIMVATLFGAMIVL